MKKLICVVSILAMLPTAQGQTWEEWSRQKKTQIKYLVNQIAAFQTNLNYIKEGYDMAHEGLTLIQKIKDGEKDLHQQFFESLRIVSPNLTGYSKIAAIVSMYGDLVKESNAIIKNSKQNGQFTFEELQPVETLINKLLVASKTDIDALKMVITSGEFKMTDDARIRRIDFVYASLQDKRMFLKDFAVILWKIGKARQIEKVEVELSKTIIDRK